MHGKAEARLREQFTAARRGISKNQHEEIMAGRGFSRPSRLDWNRACAPAAAGKQGPDRVRMHFNFDFSAGQILWTLTFAALLVLLVVLQGRDRVRRFPWFTASIAMMALLLLTVELLLNKIPRITGSLVFLAMSDLNTIIALMVVVELARRAFRGAARASWIVGTLALAAVGAAVLVLWGPWPAWKTLTGMSTLATIRLMDMAADKGNLLSSVLAIELGLLVPLLGRRFGAGWRSHAQQIVIGLSTASLAQLGLRGSLQFIGAHTHIHTQAEYVRIIGLRDKLIHANNVVYLAVLVWWIACLWIDEPGAAAHAGLENAEPQPVSSDLNAGN